MKNILRRILEAISGVVVVALLLTLAMPKTVHGVVSTLVTIVNTSANPVPTQSVKQSEANFISLVASGGGSYNLINPDGSTSGFSIPSGQQFVITDIGWVTICSHTFVTCSKSAGDTITLELGGSPTEFSPGAYNGTATYASGGFLLVASRNDALRSGLIVSQLPTPSVLGGLSGNGEEIFSVTLRGYLVP